MAQTTGNLNVSELDFHQIKTNLKDFLKGQSEFDDYNFDGSTINALLDVLAYTTHYNAFNANMAVNETFLDTAQLRSSVVSHAKLLGYTPRSAYAPRAYVDISINPPAGDPTWMINSDGTYKLMLMPRGTEYKSIIGSDSYTFVNTKTLAVPRENGTYTFKNVELIQGQYKNTEYVYDKNTAERFILPHDNAVTSSLIVTVKESKASDEKATYTLSTSIVDIDSTVNAYWIQEGKDGFYEVYFGDGYIGKKLIDGNIVQLEYVITKAGDANGASAFSLVGDISGNTNINISVIDTASGGSLGEDIPSIKFNAPLTFVAQNRAVTPDDYKSIIQANFANIRAITVWGGEDNEPPDYGKVYVTIAPKDTEVLSYSDKEFIKGQYLKPKNVVSITPEIIDPTYTYVHMDIFFKYNPNTTNGDVASLQEQVRTSIALYQENDLKRFDGVFRYSTVLNIIDNADLSILNSFARVYMKKRFIPLLGEEHKYVLTYASPILKSTSNSPIITSTGFTYAGQACLLLDVLGTDGVRVINIVSSLDNAIVYNAIGYIDESAGKIILNGFAPTVIMDSSVDYIEITVSPNSFDLAPNRNELLTILTDTINISGEVDTMITGGTAAGIDYTTTSKEK
jgi:hypothetical protein